MGNEERKFEKGQRLTAVLEENGKPVRTWVYEVTDVDETSKSMHPAISTKLIKDSGGEEVEKTRAADPAKTGLEVAKFAWEFIKDNKAVSNTADTTTSVIWHDSKPLEYANAKETKTGDLRFHVSDSIIKSWILVDVTFRLEGTYNAKPTRSDIPNGRYLPSLHFHIVKVFVGFSFKLDAKATVSQPSNMGSATNVIPQVKLYGEFKVSWLSSHTHTAGFVANGASGVRFTGWDS